MEEKKLIDQFYELDSNYIKNPLYLLKKELIGLDDINSNVKY